MKSKTCLAKIVSDGVLKAELNRFFENELSECGYTGLELRCAPNRYEVIIRVTKTQSALGPKGQRVREMTTVLCQRYQWEEKNFVIYIEQVANRFLSAGAQAAGIKFKLLEGVPVRKAVSGVLRSATEAGAEGVEVIISGKVRGQRAKALKFTSGWMVHSGQPALDFIDVSIKSVELRQGVLGIQVRIMKKQDVTGKNGPRQSLPDKVVILQPKEDKVIEKPYTETRVPVVAPVAEE